MRRLIPALMTLAMCATACTAIVLGQLGDTADFGVDAGKSSSGSSGTSGTSGTSGSSEVVDKCNLRFNENSSGQTYEKTSCSDCIDAKCGNEIGRVCVDGDYIEGFQYVRACARNPWQDYSPTGQNSSWACSSFETVPTPVTGDGETARITALNACVNNCLKGALPECKLCEVNIKEDVGSTRHLLKDDNCGKCLANGCKETLVKCCNTAGMRDFVAPCAFTNDKGNLTNCRELRNPTPDAGGNRFQYNEDDKACLTELHQCWIDNCDTKPECQ